GRVFRAAAAISELCNGTSQRLPPPPGSDTTMAFVSPLLPLATCTPAVPTRTASRNAASWFVSIVAEHTGAALLTAGSNPVTASLPLDGTMLTFSRARPVGQNGRTFWTFGLSITVED